MIGALWTGISGLAGQQTALDNESHNIANVNTIGYKASRISFADQLYQDKIGKGTKVLDAEKLFTQGNLKLTGVSYDLAISGDGFFSVKNERASGTAETFFTRAGNFRMGDDGTLQDGAGNKVQGWGMSSIDPDADVLSTNPNVNVFTTDYSKLVSSKVISHSNYVETITAKTTDYATTAEADSETIFDGAGVKSKSSKIADVEELVADYTTWLQKYQDDPEGTSASSTAQASQIKFAGTDIKKEGDQIYVYINGNKITQSWVSVVANNDAGGNGINPGSSTSEQAKDNIAASKIATYKALANQISEIPGLVAYTVKDGNALGETQGVFEADDTFTKTTFDAIKVGTPSEDMNALLGMIEIKSLIPGETFTISEVAEVSGTVTTQGQINTTASATDAVQGSGLGALESARDALSKAVSGSQRDVFTPADLNLGNANLSTGSISGEEYELAFVIYDKDTKQNVNVGPISLTGVQSVDDIIDALPKGGTTPTPAAATAFNKYFTAENINGNLIISTNDANYDVEYSTTLTAKNKSFESLKSTDSSNREVLTFNNEFSPTPDSVKDYSLEFDYTINAATTASTLNTDTVEANTGYVYPSTFNLTFTFDDVNDSLTRGGSNQTIELTITDAINENDLQTKIQGQLDAINSGEFSVTVSGGTFTLENNNNEAISALNLDRVVPSSVKNVPATGTGTSTVNLDTSNIDSYTNSYTLFIDGTPSTSVTIGADPARTTYADFQIAIQNALNADVPGDYTVGGVSPNITITDASGTPDLINAVTLNETNLPPLSITDPADTDAVAAAIEARYGDGDSTTFTGGPLNASVDTDGNLVITLNSEISGGGDANLNMSLKEIGTNQIIEKNADYSGREGAGAEFIEIVNKIDQVASQGGLQLRLDTLGISDSAFGEFNVDNSGLITMKQDGAEFAIGQVSIALFNNTRGLDPYGDNLMQKTTNSGEPIYNTNNERTANIEGGTLELSTADLSESLVNLMVFQRAFEANAKTITTSDSLLNTLINLKR